MSTPEAAPQSLTFPKHSGWGLGTIEGKKGSTGGPVLQQRTSREQPVPSLGSLWPGT